MQTEYKTILQAGIGQLLCNMLCGHLKPVRTGFRSAQARLGLCTTLQGRVLVRALPPQQLSDRQTCLRVLGNAN